VRHEKAQRSSVLIGDRMELGIHTAFGATDQAAWIPFFNRRLEANTVCFTHKKVNIIPKK